MKRKLIFMIHKHQATHLHYDLRLEIEGTLKSWALRKLPLKPNEAVIAVHVPDHPFWYRHFEGVIPEGQYGAGPVMVWEKGLYTNGIHDHNDKPISALKSYERGFLRVWLEGHKLNGEYVLLRVSKKQKWLFIKIGSTVKKTKNWNRSVKSNKTLKEIVVHYLTKKGSYHGQNKRKQTR